MDTAADLRERLKLKYMGDCKCGHCALVPDELVARASDEIERLRAELDALRDPQEFKVILSKQQLPAALEEKQRQVDYWGDRCCKAEAQRDQLLVALNLVMVGGNHIATYRTDRWPSYGTEPADALEKLGAGQEYDMWCCWAAIMTARAAIAAVEGEN